MYVLRGTLAADFEGIPAGTHQFPADRCTWTQVDDSTGGYSVSNVRFLGNGTSAATLTTPRLGYVGKSARFVPISN